MLIQGMGGISRRLYDGGASYQHAQHLLGWNEFMSQSAWWLGLAQIPFLLNLAWSLVAGKRVAENPWGATTLEWSAPWPPIHGNFPAPPVVERGPYEYGVGGDAAAFSPQGLAPAPPPQPSAGLTPPQPSPRGGEGAISTPLPVHGEGSGEGEEPIPHTVTIRPDTGTTNPKLGIWLFLASEIMLFGALFSSYVLLRVNAGAEWGEHAARLNLPLATFNTAILITSSITMVYAWLQLLLKDLGRYRLYMGLTILLGLVFLVAKGFEYGEKFSHGLHPSESTFLAIYFTLTGLHGLHVLGGVLVNGFLLGPGSRLWTTAPARFTNRVEIAGVYWHFVDLVWIFLFPTLYLLG